MDTLLNILSVVAPITWSEAFKAMDRRVSLIIDGDLKDELTWFRSVLDFGSSKNVIAGDRIAPCSPFYVNHAIGVVFYGEICHCD